MLQQRFDMSQIRAYRFTTTPTSSVKMVSNRGFRTDAIKPDDVYRNSVPTSQKTLLFHYKDQRIIAAYYENLLRHTEMQNVGKI
jgi:hypothetical protein